jgi:hypothetical protein
LINEGLSLIAGKVKSFKCLKKSPPSGGFGQRTSLPDVAAVFCRNVPQAKRGTPSAACKLCYMLKAQLRKVLYKRNTDVERLLLVKII